MTAQHLVHFGDALSRGQLINWDYLGFLFKQISPYFFACLGISLAVGLSIAGAAWCAWASSESSKQLWTPFGPLPQSDACSLCLPLCPRKRNVRVEVLASWLLTEVQPSKRVSEGVCERRGIFITGSSLLGAAIRVPRITSKNLIRCLPPVCSALSAFQAELC